MPCLNFELEPTPKTLPTSRTKILGNVPTYLPAYQQQARVWVDHVGENWFNISTRGQRINSIMVKKRARIVQLRFRSGQWVTNGVGEGKPSPFKSVLKTSTGSTDFGHTEA